VKGGKAAVNDESGTDEPLDDESAGEEPEKTQEGNS